jgi:hypothetical protein
LYPTLGGLSNYRLYQDADVLSGFRVPGPCPKDVPGTGSVPQSQVLSIRSGEY